MDLSLIDYLPAMATKPIINPSLLYTTIDVRTL